MARVKKAQAKPHLVIPDTSTLWYEDKGPTVDPKFNTFWDEYTVPFSLELHVPELCKERFSFSKQHQQEKALRRQPNQLVI